MVKYFVGPSNNPASNIVDNAFFDDMKEAIDLMVQMQADFPDDIWAVFEAEIIIKERLPVISTT